MVHVDSYPPYELLEDVEVWQITIPKGFRFDGATVPKFARPFFDRLGRNALAALLHDYLYTTGQGSRWLADRMLYTMLRQQGVGKIKAGIVWLAVRLFGAGRWRR